MFDWQKDNHGGYQAQMPDNVTLVVTPDRYAKGFSPKAARGTKWKAGASHWDETTRTLSRFGRDCYNEMKSSREEAMRLAESVYLEAVNASNSAR